MLSGSIKVPAQSALAFGAGNWGPVHIHDWQSCRRRTPEVGQRAVPARSHVCPDLERQRPFYRMDRRATANAAHRPIGRSEFAFPLGLIKETEAGAVVYGCIGTGRGRARTDEAISWLERKLRQRGNRYRASGVVAAGTAGLRLPRKGRRPGRAGLLAIPPTGCTAATYSTVDAAHRARLVGPWTAAARLGNWPQGYPPGPGNGMGPGLRWSYSMARIGEAADGRSQGPGANWQLWPCFHLWGATAGV